MKRARPVSNNQETTPVIHIVKKQSGFSLLEMMVVISLLAATAYVATGAYTHFLDHADEQLVYSEMQEIAKAIRQFKQDTGYYPKEGPFALQLLTTDPGNVTKTMLPNYIGNTSEGLTNDEISRWFYSPANLYQLTTDTSPLSGSSHQLKEWNPETGRGWRGPYLSGFRDGYVDIRDGISSSNSPAGNKDGDPLSGNNIPDVVGIADPFVQKYETISGNTLLDWSRNRRRMSTESTTDPDRLEVEKWGRPYLVFDLDTKPWLVSFGPNGNFDNGEFNADPNIDKDDITLNIE